MDQLKLFVSDLASRMRTICLLLSEKQKITCHRFPMKLDMLLLQDKEILKT